LRAVTARRGEKAGSLKGRIFALAAALARSWPAWLWTPCWRATRNRRTRPKPRILVNSVAQQGERSIEARRHRLARPRRSDPASGGIDMIDRNRVRHSLLSRRSGRLLQVSASRSSDCRRHRRDLLLARRRGFRRQRPPLLHFHRDRPAAGAAYQRAVVARATAPMSRREPGHRTPTGRFDGVVTAALEMRVFQEFYDG